MEQGSRAQLNSLLRKVENYMEVFTRNTYKDSAIGKVLYDALSTRGKMIRPRLVLLSGMYGDKFEQKSDRLCRLAAIVEIIHMASLVHDDIVDDAPFRRGKLSVQGKYGKSEAVYAGDFMISRISYQLLKDGMNEAGLILAKAVEEMCVGEIGQSMCRYNENVTKEEYLANIHGKTAALMMAACKVGASESGCSPDVIIQLERFGECLGMLFQLRDDLMDYTSDHASIGKHTQMDFSEGIYTMPLLCVLEQTEGKRAMQPYLRKNEMGRLSKVNLDNIQKIIIAHKGIEKTQEMIEDYKAEAFFTLKALESENKTASELIFLMIEELLKSKK